jgi:pyrimidine operon attenuation protein/uracil phosphoribosyltransferase
MNPNKILNNLEIEFKIKRIAFQIYETFIEEDVIIIAGIQGNGSILAQKIKKALAVICPIKTVLCEVYIDKKKTRIAHYNFFG